MMDTPLPVWLKGLMDAIRPNTDDGLGIAAYAYDVTQRPFQVREFMVEDCPIEPQGIAQLMDSSNDDFVRRSWLIPAAVTASETPGYDRLPAVSQVFHPVGIRDVLVVNALDPVGVGVWIGTPLRTMLQLDEATRERWNRVAMHVRAALRLRMRLQLRETATNEPSGEAEAVFTPHGDIEHLSASAERSREALREAVLDVERARGVLRNDTDKALPSWKALVQARWTLVDDFQVDGKRFVLARSNGFATPTLDVLAPRERQVAACLAMGHTNKEIAYELGLSHSTVRVLVVRAFAKLGVTKREEFVALYRRAQLG